jgi:AcrR family transcriptional regulator/DNA-binding MarR family transcriptional regulator
MFSLAEERGYAGVSARGVAERAGVSNRTFYQCFSDREDCFLAAFNYAVDGLERELRAGWESELGWTARVRAALAALLMELDREPAVRRLVFVEALAAGPRVLARRASVLERLAGVVDQGRANAQAPATLPPLVAEGVVGATFSVIHARALELRPGPLVALSGSLMATIVLPYRGSAAAAREFARPIPRPPARRRDRDGLSRRPPAAASPIDYRLTVSTQMALAAVAGRPGMNNREVSETIGLSDQSQISRMMKRLSDHGLVESAQAHTKRQARAWRLTADGEAVIDAHRPLKQAQRETSRVGKRRGTQIVRPAGEENKSLGREGGRDLSAGRISGPAFRMTVLTHEVLTAISNLSGQGPNPCNRALARAAGVKDEAQISRLLARLEGHGLLENTGGPAAGGNAWRLTDLGQRVTRDLSLNPPPGREDES